MTGLTDYNTRKTEKLTVTMKADYSFRNSGKFYGYRYYIGFEPLHEFMTNSSKLYNALEEGKTYEIEYQPTPDRCIAPGSVSIMVDMKKLKIIREI